jgi:hypothetical protein
LLGEKIMAVRKKTLLHALGTLLSEYGSIDAEFDSLLSENLGDVSDLRKLQHDSNRTRDRIQRLYDRAHREGVIQ